MAVPPELDATARAWLEDDPDPVDRAELAALLADGDPGPLRARFGARLTFGTAGIRGPLGAGPARMNRALVRRVAAGLAAHLLAGDPDGTRAAGVAIGRDGRHRSVEFADEVAAVLAAAGIPAHVLPGPCPTPVLAFAVRHLGAAAGVMVTASHNPPADNGLKVYGSDGAQIVAPTDAAISDAIDAVGPTAAIPVALADDPLIRPTGEAVVEAYLDVAADLVEPGPRGLLLVHTAMHGVATPYLHRLLDRVGIERPVGVAAQADPDPAFPTVPFPNPEEPGALDLALSEARRIGADAVVAHDPDADRLAVAVREPTGWRALTGDEVGALLADHLLASGDGDDRLVVRSLVSSTLLDRIADAHGVRSATTLTGFKWIVRAAADLPGTRFTFGYEEALGYAVTDAVRDKDGLTAALVLIDLLGDLVAAGSSIPERLEGLARRHGLHATRTWSVRVTGADAAPRIAEAVARVVDAPPTSLAGAAVTAVDRPAPDVVVLTLDGGARAVVRPSGTEPKVKSYLQVVVADIAPGADGWAAARTEGDRRLDDLQAALAELTGLA